MEKVSIVVPVYNVIDYIDECLQSIIHQTFTKLEIILVDDGSDDGSGEKCDSYASLDSRVFVIHQKNRGVSAARNKGIEAATGFWIMFVDSDDWLELDAVEILMKKSVISKEIDLIAGSYYYNYPDFQENRTKKGISEALFNMEDYRNLFYGMCLTSEASPKLFPEELRCGPQMSFPVLKLYKKQLILDEKIYFKEGFDAGEDQLFNIHFIKLCKELFFINKPIYHYRMRKGSASNNIKTKKNNYLRYNIIIREEVNTLTDYENIKPYWNHVRVQHMWSLAQLYGNSIHSVSDLLERKTLLKEFVENQTNAGAITGTKLSTVMKFSRKLMVGCLKCHAYYSLLILCKAYYLMNTKKERV